jgi:hypothetical protein
MAIALNMTMPIKQDSQTQATLQELKASFAQEVQPAIEAALRESEIVHFARVLVIDDKYIQVITEFDGDPQDYTEFFRVKLPGVFKAIFSVVEGVPSWEEMNNANTFFEIARGFNLKALGADPGNNPTQGYLFSAYGDEEVRTIKALLQANNSSGSTSGASSGASSGATGPATGPGPSSA